MTTTYEQEHENRSLRGYKAALHNPNADYRDLMIDCQAENRFRKKLRDMQPKCSLNMAPRSLSRMGRSSILLTFTAERKNIRIGLLAAIKRMPVQTLANEHTSPEAKERARDKLEEAGIDVLPSPHDATDAPRQDHGLGLGTSGENENKDEEHAHRVLGGYKATLSNPRTSQEAKEHAQDMIDQIEGGGSAFEPMDKLDSHVIGGYKATLSNPHTSDEAKEHARQVLESHGEIV